MADTQKNAKIPEFLREPIEAAQARLEAFEAEAQKVYKDLVAKGRASRKDFQVLVQRLSKQDWKVTELRGRFDRIRDTGLERASEWRGKADSFRAEALEKLEELQAKAVQFLGAASREQVEELSRELSRLSKRLEGEKAAAKKAPAAKAKKTTKRAAQG